MKRLSWGVAMLGALAFASPAFAAGYGAAGCGFGGLLIKDNKKLPQIGAWLLNGVLGNQTFGISSGTSECGSSGPAPAEKEQKSFIENNYHSLAREMATGEGEELRTLAGLLGCPSGQVGDFGVFAQKNYASLFKSDGTTPAEMLDALKEALSGDQRFASSCDKI